MSRPNDREDIRLYLTDDEVCRLIYLLDNAPQRSPVDRRLLRILTTQLERYLELNGGTNGNQ